MGCVPHCLLSASWCSSLVEPQLIDRCLALKRSVVRRCSDLAKRGLLTVLAQQPELQRYDAMLRDESFNVFYDAGTLIVIGCAARTRLQEADCWLAAEHLMLAARAEGLGTCCIGFALDALNTDEVVDIDADDVRARLAPPRARSERVPDSSPKAAVLGSTAGWARQDTPSGVRAPG
jgi:hypothetical protein